MYKLFIEKGTTKNPICEGSSLFILDEFIKNIEKYLLADWPEGSDLVAYDEFGNSWLNLEFGKWEQIKPLDGGPDAEPI